MSALEEHFALQVLARHLPKPEREYRFAKAALKRQWRMDFAWPAFMLAVEIEGGTWGRKRSRHTTGSGFQKDCEKYNAAAILGWTVLRGDSKMVKSGELIETLVLAFERAA